MSRKDSRAAIAARRTRQQKISRFMFRNASEGNLPWTNRQFRYLMSKGSPLTEGQKDKDQAEAHANPSMIHRKKKSTIAQARERVHGHSNR